MKKKILAALVCAAMTASLAGCAGNETSALMNIASQTANDKNSSAAANSTPASSNTESTAASSAAESAPTSSEPESTPASSAPVSAPESSAPESKPSVSAEDIDWSAVPEIDEMDLNYTKQVADGGYITDTCVIITDYYGDAEYINIPQTIDGVSKIAVSKYVNWGDKAKAIKFPDGIEFGTSDSDGCGTGSAPNVKSVFLLDSVVSIGNFDLPSLEEITLPENLMTITDGTFRHCGKLKSVTFNENLAEIGENAFSGCEKLKSVAFGENIKSLGRNAFCGCTALETVNFPAKFASGECGIGGGAFSGCTSLKSIELPEGITFTDVETSRDYGGVFSGDCSLESITLPSTVTVLPNDIFANCIVLNEVNLPSTLEKIGNCAFASCVALRKIDIPDSVTRIGNHYGDEAFHNCHADIEINYKGKTYNSKNIEKLYNRDLSKM